MKRLAGVLFALITVVPLFSLDVGDAINCYGIVGGMKREYTNGSSFTVVVKFKNMSGKDIRAFKCTLLFLDEFNKVTDKDEVYCSASRTISADDSGNRQPFLFRKDETLYWIRVDVPRMDTQEAVFRESDFQKNIASGAFNEIDPKTINMSYRITQVAFTDGTVLGN